jgi:hypothetical protein
MERALFACSVHNSCGDSMIGRYASDDTDFFDFQSKSRASGKKSAFHLEYQPPTNSHKADSFSLTDVSSGKIQNQHQSDFWRVILQKKDRVGMTRSFMSCQVDYHFSLSSIVQMLTRFQSGSENMSPTPLP